MNDNLPLLTKLNFAFMHAAYAYMEYEKTSKFLRTRDGEPLYFAEVHMVAEVKMNQGLHVSALAEKLNITIGAASQTLMKLEKKGLIRKEKDPRNLSRFLIKLTEEGEEIHENHERFHHAFDDVLEDILSGTTDTERTFLLKFLSAVEKKIGELK